MSATTARTGGESPQGTGDLAAFLVFLERLKMVLSLKLGEATEPPLVTNPRQADKGAVWSVSPQQRRKQA